MGPYVQSLLLEMAQKSDLIGSLGSVYLGGGTPSILSIELMSEIMDGVYRHFQVEPDAEITVEANPESLDLDKIRSYLGLGVNRMSIGVQSLNDKLLSTIGRLHTVKEAQQAFFWCREAGFKNLSIDLMFALPGQSLGDFENDLNSALELKPDHISCYSLTLEEHSPLLHLDLPDEQTDRNMYHMAVERFNEAGLYQYELSNFSKKGLESRHNGNYWVLGDYLGLGPGAHSFTKNTRYQNTESLSDYLAGDFSAYESHLLTPDELMSEYVFLGLRTTKGVSFDSFQKKFGKKITDVFGLAIEKNLTGGLLCARDGHIFLTPRGMDLANQVFMDFL